jgi:hypothetical protein
VKSKTTYKFSFCKKNPFQVEFKHRSKNLNAKHTLFFCKSAQSGTHAPESAKKSF